MNNQELLEQIAVVIYPNLDGAPSQLEQTFQYLQGRGLKLFDTISALEKLSKHKLPASCSHFLLLPDHLCCDPLALLALDQDLFTVQCLPTDDGGAWCDQYLPSGIWFGQKESLAKISLSNSTDFFTPHPVGTFSLKDKEQVEYFLSPRPTLFLDRDGVVIEDVGYPYRPEDLKIRPGIIPVIKWATQHNWLVVILTNQSGLARGIFTGQDYQQFTQLLLDDLTKLGAQIDGVYHSPYHPDGKVKEYSYRSHTRKPEVGMVLQAMEQLPIDLTRSVMIGDKHSDQLKIPLLKCILIKGSYPLRSIQHSTKVVESDQEIIEVLSCLL
jgi:D-glycero-D-manno-heptose 1,7-bisphosphate phosphatase